MDEGRYEIAKFVDGSLELEVNVSPNEDTVWLTQDDMALLFDKARSTISEHIRNIFNEKELDSAISKSVATAREWRMDRQQMEMKTP